MERVAGGRASRLLVAAGVTAMMGLGVAGAANAQPAPDPCSPAAVMRAHAAAMTQLADYLDSRPDVQQVFWDARSQPTPQARHDMIRGYTDTHPDVAAAFGDIRQPVQDLSTRCDLPMHSGMHGGPGAGPMGHEGMGAGPMGPGSMTPGQ